MADGPYFSPAWSRQQALIEYSLRLFIPGMQKWGTERLTLDYQKKWRPFWESRELVQQFLSREVSNGA